MTDIELLERAARAAGIELDEHGRITQQGHTWGWSPLDSDGDAFRLMVALSIDVEFFQGFMEVRATPFESELDAITEAFTGDRSRDVRIAIVRAAAAMGVE